MKKILTVSLVAVMAVSAAHANIASTKYVDDKETALNEAIAKKADSSTVTALDAAYKQADTALGGRIDTLSGTVTANKTVTDKTQEDLDALEATVAGLTGDTGILSGLDLAAVQSEGKAIVSVSQADGKVSASVGTISTAGIDDSAVTTAKIADANVTAAKLSTDAKALFDGAGSAATAKSEAIEAAKTETQNQVKALADGQVKTNTANIAANTAKFADYSTTVQMDAELAKKQNNLTPGDNITIGADGKISANAVNSTQGLSDAQLLTAIPSVSMVDSLIADSNADTETTVGKLINLTTTEKGNIVAAINEVDANADAAKAAADAKLASVSSNGSGVVKTVVQNGTAVEVTAGAVAKSELATGVQTSLGLADSALQKADITSGKTNGTISVEGTDVAVKGLGSAAYVATTAFDAAGSAATAKSEAIAAAKTETQTQVSALENGQVKTNKTGIATINTNLGPLAGVTIPDACATDAVCSLVMNKGKVAWEVISY